MVIIFYLLLSFLFSQRESVRSFRRYRLLSLERDGSISFSPFFLSCGWFAATEEPERKREREVSVVGKLFGELINSLRDWKKRYYKGRDSSGVWRFFSFNRDLSST